MAKGFITLENGEDFSVRWTGYDEVIRIAIKELDILDANKHLSAWLKTRVPNENEDEGDMVFHNAKGEMIVRHIDLRGLTKANRLLFWSAIENGATKLSESGDGYSMLNPIVMANLMDMHTVAKDDIEIIEANNKGIVTKNDIIEKIGPGWLEDHVDN